MFEFKLDKSALNERGNVEVSPSQFKKNIENIAEDAFHTGKAAGFVAGALFVSAMWAVTELADAFLAPNDKK